MTTSSAGSIAALLRMVLVVVVFILAIYFLTIVFVSQDPFWFQKGFVEKPVYIVVYNSGQRNEYRPGDPGYDLLAGAIQQSLNDGVLRQSGVGMSEETLADAYGKYVSVEAFFNQPVKLHSNYNTGWPTRMIFPITGRHSDLSVIFLGNDESYRINGPVLNNIQPVRDALSQLNVPIN